MTEFSSVNALFQVDAYKLDHRRQYGLSGNVTRVYSNYTNRKSRIPGVDHVVHFGLQAHLMRMMEDWQVFFDSPKDLACQLYHDKVAKILGPDAADAIGTDHIAALHDLGYLPLEFRAVPEGTLVPIRVPSVTVENTHDEFFWLTNYIETALSTGLWLPSTSATIANTFRMMLERKAIETGASQEALEFQLHDFSYRGMYEETARVSGAGHLLSFKGSDTLTAMSFIDRYYGGEYDCMSVAATEHSVMSTGIMSAMGTVVEYDAYIGDRGLAEARVFELLLDLYPTGILSVVSDTFDLFNVLERILPAWKDKIMARNGKLVIRPDSGDPLKIICGNPAGRTVAERRGVVELLWETFGGTVNAKGYRELDPHIGAIYGDSITLERGEAILNQLQKMGYASTNIVFGIGSFTYQYQTRDTFGSAIKATWALVNGRPVKLFKDPVTDDGTKKSATGRLAVLEDVDGGDLYLVEDCDAATEARSLLQPMWRDGKFLKFQSFPEVREVLAKQRERLVS